MRHPVVAPVVQRQRCARIKTLMAAGATGDLGAMQDFVRNCMSDYDVSGWTAKDLINPDDINLVSRGQVQG
jgi:4-hydroxyphenylacetate 3-monooxygenase